MGFKKPLVGLAVGGALMAAVFGSAANITNTATKLGGSSAAVSACDSTISTAWASAYDATLGQYKVTTVTVSNIDGTACDTATIKVSLADGSNALLGSEKTAVIGTADTFKTFEFGTDQISTSDMSNAHVTIVGP